MNGARALIGDGDDLFLLHSGEEGFVRGNPRYNPVRMKDIVIHASNGEDGSDAQILTQGEQDIQKIAPPEVRLFRFQYNNVFSARPGRCSVKCPIRRGDLFEDPFLDIYKGAALVVPVKEVGIHPGKAFGVQFTYQKGGHSI